MQRKGVTPSAAKAIVFCGRKAATISTFLVFASICGVSRALATFFVYVGFTVIIFAIFELPAKPGSGVCTTCSWAYSPGVAPAVQCVINLTVQYFTVFGLLMAAKLYSTFFNRGRKTFSSQATSTAS